MKEYAIENGKPVDWIAQPHINNELYQHAHAEFIIPCHDVWIWYDDGIILVRRKNYPANNDLWPIGGRILKGVPILKSLQHKVKAECGLHLANIEELGFARTLFSTDPFGHGKGTETMNACFVARGLGTITLDDAHEEPTIVTRKLFSELKQSLHPFVRDFMSLALEKNI